MCYFNTAAVVKTWSIVSLVTPVTGFATGLAAEAYASVYGDASSNIYGKDFTSGRLYRFSLNLNFFGLLSTPTFLGIGPLGTNSQDGGHCAAALIA